MPQLGVTAQGFLFSPGPSAGLSVEAERGGPCAAGQPGSRASPSTAADQLRSSLTSLTSRDLLSTICEGDGGSCLAQRKGLRNSH